MVSTLSKALQTATDTCRIHLSIMMFEILTVFIPVIQVIRLRILARRAAKSTAKWEADSQATLTLRSSSSIEQLRTASLHIAEKGRKSSSNDHSMEHYLDLGLGDRLLTMTALDHVLAENSGPLQDFSALSDFSGENIAFLTRMMAWKASYSWSGSPTISEEEVQPLAMFNQALDIYIEFISPHYAPFPLNISSQALKQLEDIFREAAETVRGAPVVNPATPFDMPHLPSSGHEAACYTGSVPGAFSSEVFDDVRDSVKYLVLTNTWPKFVAEMQERHRQRQRRSGDTERTGTSMAASSQRTLVAKVSQKFHELM